MTRLTVLALTQALMISKTPFTVGFNTSFCNNIDGAFGYQENKIVFVYYTPINLFLVYKEEYLGVLRPYVHRGSDVEDSDTSLNSIVETSLFLQICSPQA